MKTNFNIAVLSLFIFILCVFSLENKTTSFFNFEEQRDIFEEFRSKKLQQESHKSLKQQQKELKKQISQEIKNYEERHNVDIYLGKGVALIEKDPSAAIEEAKKKALSDLISSIRAKIKTTISNVIKYETKTGTEQKLEMITNVYAEEVLRHVVTKNYYDYPKNRMVTVICYVSIKDYNQAVQEEISKTMAQISKYAIEGLKLYQGKMILTALQNFIVGKQHLSKCLYDLPALYDIDADGKPDDLYAFFDTSIIKIIRNIKLEPIDKDIVYGVDGKIYKYPVVRVVYEETNEKIPIEGIKLKISFIDNKDAGVLISNVTSTNKLGEAQIPIEKVNPYYKNNRLQVEVDLQELNIDEKYYSAPYCIINLRKKKVFAYSINFSNAGKKVSSQSFNKEVKSVLRKMKYDVVEYNFNDEKKINEIISFLATKNFDYYLVININANGGNVGDYNMFYSDINCSFDIYILPEGELISSVETGPSARGYGVTLISAGENALMKIKDKLIMLIENELSNLN